MTNRMPRNRLPVFALLCIVSVGFWWQPLATTAKLALSNDAYTHILLILPLSAALIYLDLKQQDVKSISSNKSPVNAQPSPLTGAVLLSLALAMNFYGRWAMRATPDDVRLSLGMFSLVTWWIASVVLCFGARTVRSFLFPLCFLFLIIPIPSLALNWIVEFLQQQSASAARILFHAIGVPVTQDGIMLSIPNLDIEVARECSSIRSSLMLVVTTMFLAHLFLSSWWRQALLVVAAIPLSVAKNGLRIVTIGALGTRVDPGFLTGKLHHNGGILFFGVAVAAVATLLWMLWRTEHPIAGTARVWAKSGS
ncbi:MAG TPA: exosortase/archaeosortase family protein [Terriglobales bacterium]|jgi:exosortase|nr:exosortase/archaeosortase family protein [Terriglobales bacterium]